MPSLGLRVLACALLGTVACTGRIGDTPLAPPPPPPRPSTSPTAPPVIPPAPFVPAPGGLRLQTPTQYQNAVRALLGEDLEVPAVGSWRSSIAAAQGGVSFDAVSAYEAAADEAARAVFTDETRRRALVGCEPGEQACLSAFVARFGRLAWRRALTTEEISRYVALAVELAAEPAPPDPWFGVRFAVVGLLQSPNFLYRVELGQPDGSGPGRRRYTGVELASRLSYFLWDGPPDAALLDAAERGELDTLPGLEAAVARLSAAPASARGVTQFFTDLLDLDALPELVKDTREVPLYTPTTGARMRAQLRALIDDVFVAGDGDYRRLFTTRKTFVDDQLAPLYGLPANVGPELVPLELPADGPRAGLLTYPGILARHAGEADTSPSLRGLFVRRTFLCQNIPGPPPGVATTIPEPAPGELVTTRQLLARHRQDPSCAACHDFMDPIGFALETFDTLGIHRTTENGLMIDTRGTLDGRAFDDARGLGLAVRDHPELGRCFVRNAYRYAAGHIETAGERVVIDELTAQLPGQDYSAPALFRAIATSDGFRFTADPTEP